MLPQQVAEGLVGELLPRLHRISRQEVEGLPGFLVEFYQLAPRRRRIFRRAHADSDLDPAHGPRNKRATRPIVHERSIKTGPRAAWDIGGQVASPAGRVLACSQRGMDQLRYALEDIRRGCDLGLRGVLVADLGLIWLVDEARRSGQLPANLVVKTSVQLPAANPAAVHVLERLGAGTLNLAVDLTLPQLAAVRSGTSLPFDLYIEAPDGFGGFIRYYELPEIVRVAAPVYVKLGLRNSPDIYPCGTHLEPTAIALSVERVRRARLALDTLQRYAPELQMSAVGAADLAVPEVVG